MNAHPRAIQLSTPTRNGAHHVNAPTHRRAIVEEHFIEGEWRRRVGNGGEWGDVFGDEVMAAELIDRLVHHRHIVNIRGNSYRMCEHHARTPGARVPLGISRFTVAARKCEPPSPLTTPEGLIEPG